ncbi:MAG: hypothetical protein DWQ10_01730 [Calditrichaeota bacterium]|nr:MAG: hypothetical protein DWQ10_01730 [Calditrichota bacterium]
MKPEEQTEEETEKIFEEIDGVIAVEAEDFVTQDSSTARMWHTIAAGQIPNITPDPDPIHLLDASGGAYLEILPDTRATHADPLQQGVNFTNTPGEIATLTYKVWINTPGKYYVSVRAYSTGSEDNGIHVGLDGFWPESGKRMQWCDGKNAWTWESKQRTEANHCGEAWKIYLDIFGEGLHTIHFSMREDGFEFDKWFMSLEKEKPTGHGPAPVVRSE